MNLPTLWPIQQPWFEQVKAQAHADGRIVAQAPTGFGKTECASRIVAGTVTLNNSAFVLCHLDALIDQISKRFTKLGIDHGVIASGYPTKDSLVQICSQQSLIHRLDWYQPPVVTIWDECHHSVSPSALRIVDWLGSNALIGLTATPQRTDGKGLDHIYKSMVLAPQIKELIPEYLVQPVVYAPPTNLDLSKVKSEKGDYRKQGVEDELDKAFIVGKSVEHYQKICPGLKAVVFCLSLRKCAETVEAFKAAGIKAAQLDGTMSKTERRRIVADFEDGDTMILVSCQLITEGFDCKKIECVIHQRPTKSVILYMQANGRGLRKDVGKEFCIIIDMVGNVWRHGFPDSHREWSLEGRRKTVDKESVPQVRRCPRCHACFPPSPICPYCSFEIPVAERELVEVDGQLILTTAEQHIQELAMKAMKKRSLLNAIGRARTEDEFLAIAIERGYNNPQGWAKFHFNRRKAKMRG